MCEIYSRLTIKTPEQRQWRQAYFTHFSSVSIVAFEQVNISWGCIQKIIALFRGLEREFYELVSPSEMRLSRFFESF